MNAQEVRGIERGFNARYRLLLQMFLSLVRQGDVIVLSLDIIELRDRNDMYSCSVAHNNPLGIFSGIPGRSLEFRNGRQLSAEALLAACESLFEALGAKRFQQIIHRMDLKRAQCMLVIGRGEYDGHVGTD